MPEIKARILTLICILVAKIACIDSRKTLIDFKTNQVYEVFWNNKI